MLIKKCSSQEGQRVWRDGGGLHMLKGWAGEVSPRRRHVHTHLKERVRPGGEDQLWTEGTGAATRGGRSL